MRRRATAAPWSFPVVAYRIVWTTGSPSDTADLGRVPTISLFEDKSGATEGKKHAIVYFWRSWTDLAAPSLNKDALHMNFLVSDFEHVLALLRTKGIVSCEFYPRGKASWASLLGPLQARS